MSSSSSSSPQETSSRSPSESDAEGTQEQEEKPYRGPLYWAGWGHFQGVPSHDLTSEEVAEIRPDLVREMISQKVYTKRRPHDPAAAPAHTRKKAEKEEEPETVADDPGPSAWTPQIEV